MQVTRCRNANVTNVVTEERTLIIGADSQIGAALLRTLEAGGQATISTTRRRWTVSPTRLFLDLSADVEHFDPPSRVESVYLVAAVTSIERCEIDPASWVVNVINPTKLAARLLQQGCHLTFLSTNAVFGGDRSSCGEDEPVSPTMAYARQKVAAEHAILEAADQLGALERLSITRLTKALAWGTLPLSEWFRQLELGNVIQPFSDLVMSPISLSFVTSSLLRINAARVSGILHLSGERDVSYAELAEKLVSGLGLPRVRVAPTTSVEAGGTVRFRPRYASLGMDRTTQLAGICAEPLEQLTAHLINTYREANGSGPLRHAFEVP